MDLKTIKPGDEVKSFTKGWMKVVAVDKSGFKARRVNIFNISTERSFFYDYDGKRYKNDERSEIVEFTSKIKNPEEWEPKQYNINYFKNITGGMDKIYGSKDIYVEKFRKEGYLHPSWEAAENAEKFHKQNRLLDLYVQEWVAENDPEWEPIFNESGNNYCIHLSYYSDKLGKASHFSIRYPGIVYMPKGCADQLLADIKSGRVTFLN